MTKIKFIFTCLTNSIKKYIFKSQKAEICQECKKLLGNVAETEDEYLKNYNTTTRWQTV